MDHFTIVIITINYSRKCFKRSFTWKIYVNPVRNDIPTKAWKAFFITIKEMILTLSQGSIWQVESQERDD